MYKQHLQYLRGLQSLGEPHVGTDQVADVVSQRIPQLAAKRAADNQGEDLNTTDMIRQAARIAFPGDARLENEAVLAWRSSSGAAHGLPWPLFGSPGMRMTKLAGEDGIAEFQAGGSLDRMANTYMAAFHLADVGWGLLERRGSATA
ncbi:hypothetical protein R6244_27425 [Mycolicibacterium sp. D5.8-2]|nr:hypothetical protein [Mycolicibacterium sp. D5.8-2]